jgi:hypothetical protein
MSIVLLGSTSGSCTLQEQAVAGTTTLTLPTFDGTVGLLVSGTAVASTSGTSIDFTSIPAGVRRITVMFSGVSTNSTSLIQTQLGAGSVTTSGYLSVGSRLQDSTAVSVFSATTGFVFSANGGAANAITGSLVITLINSNLWIVNGVFLNATTQTMTQAGSISLGGTLDRVRITTVNGTDTFDAGSINILYE